MNRTYSLFIALLLTIITLKINSQNNLFIGTQIPLTYNLGYEFQFSTKWSISSQFGILTKPYDKAILTLMEEFGTDEQLVNTVGEAFSYGLAFQPEIIYTIRKWEIGIFYSYFFLKAEDAPKNAIENYYGVSFPIRPPIFIGSNNLTLTSNLYNAGIKFGRKFFFKNPAFEIRTEFDFAKTFASKSKLTANDADIDRISELVDKDLNEYYIDYGYLPALNIRLLYHLNK